jgi:ABC-type transport system involved in cytochrome c biogenesis permease subunit
MLQTSNSIVQVLGIALGVVAGIWVLSGAGLALGGLFGSNRHLLQRYRLWWLRTGAGVIAGLILTLGFWLFEPILFATAPAAVEKQKLVVPDYNYRSWYALPVQEGGRVKPFQTACIEAMRQINGRSTFEVADPNGKGQTKHIDSVAVVLQWMFLNGTSSEPGFIDWEKYPFILCPHHDLRKVIYAHLQDEGKTLTEEQLHGKYISPADLRSSKGLWNLIEEARKIRDKDSEKAQQLMSPEQRKAEEVVERLVRFDSICQNNPESAPRRTRQHEDPFHFVALDRVPGGGWFSISQLKEMSQDGKQWEQVMQERLAHAPQLYIKPERLEALRQFQQQIKSGQWQKSLDELAAEMKARNDALVKRIEAEDKASKGALLDSLVHSAMAGAGHDQMLPFLRGVNRDNKDEWRAAIMKGYRASLTQQEESVLDDLKKRCAAAAHSRYHPDKPEFQQLHLNYLENRFPDLYKESTAWQEFPAADADQVLVSYRNVRQAYTAGDAAPFEQASQKFFDTLREVSEKVGPYPGEDTAGERLLGVVQGRPLANPSQSLLNLELLFNRVQPFMWAWVLMLLSMAFFVAHLILQNRACYLLGFAVFALSFALQTFGFYIRVAIAGRPPVSNMYETVVWVAFMSSVFALILELIYRRGLIILAGTMVATLGLVLADQLPLVLDPKISPIVPVLRSNYWLTIHVLTIVSSYAGGTLAWGLGNIALGMLAFGTPRREALKTLSQFSYRAMQIAVLLLAAGTFLGGWWAAESWGRFWGWDPKEVWALIALVCYVIPLHLRYIGLVKDFGLAVSAVICYAAIVMSWYGVNFVLGAGLHSYGFGGGGPWWVFWAGLLNIEWVLVASLIYLRKTQGSVELIKAASTPIEELVQA